jgi:ComF family protein
VLCDNALNQSENEICISCETKIPQLPYRFGKPNPIDRLFKNKVSIDGANAYLPYIEGGTALKLIHALKYKGHKHIGQILGQNAAEHIKDRNPEYQPETIIPVPLHFSKELKRGYNQCHLIASGMNQVFKCQIDKSVVRNVESKSQTKKSRYDRFKSMEGVFSVADPSSITEKNILIIDDVITTGATMFSIIKEVSKYSPSNIHVYSICCRL